tara:strand:+ start:106 stop:678 length:573 start_codon:yes stop_codon:yes gene_type:complete
MRNLINILVLFVTLTTFGQDVELFDYINVYRTKNGVGVIKWDSTLCDKSVSHVNTLNESISGDTVRVFHSDGFSWENVVHVGGMGANIKDDNKNFNIFLSKYYDVEEYDPNTVDTTKVESYIKLYMVYSWSKSQGHNKVMLMKSHKKGGCDTSIKDVHFVDNKVTLFGVTKYTKFNPSYSSLSFGVITFE